MRKQTNTHTNIVQSGKSCWRICLVNRYPARSPSYSVYRFSTACASPVNVHNDLYPESPWATVYIYVRVYLSRSHHKTRGEHTNVWRTSARIVFTIHTHTNKNTNWRGNWFCFEGFALVANTDVCAVKRFEYPKEGEFVTSSQSPTVMHISESKSSVAAINITTCWLSPFWCLSGCRALGGVRAMWTSAHNRSGMLMNEYQYIPF